MVKKIGLFAVSSLLFASPLFAFASTLERSLDIGMSGSDVSSLQTFLAKDVAVYPSGLVTGYFGELTKAGIERFQTKNGIVSSGTPATTGYGRVGPLTRASINAQMGNVVTGGDTYAPVISSLNLAVGSSGATATWNSNESARGMVHYQTSFPSMTEGSATTRALIGGTVITEGTYGFSHSITLPNLQSGTTYYYVVESVDASGNQVLTWPATFRTQ